MNDRLAIYMLDVGQGDSTLILLPGDPVRAVVFDCADEDVLSKVLGDWNVELIEAFILSHLDQDHIAGALEFLRNFAGEIRQIYVPSADRDVSNAHDEAKRAKELLDHVNEHSRDAGSRKRRWELYSNERLPRPLVEGAGWAIKLLAPHHGQHIERELRRVRSNLLEVPCAGTVMVVLHLDGEINVFPTPGGGHDSVVDDWDRPMCRP